MIGFVKYVFIQIVVNKLMQLQLVKVILVMIFCFKERKIEQLCFIQNVRFIEILIKEFVIYDKVLKSFVFINQIYKLIKNFKNNFQLLKYLRIY